MKFHAKYGVCSSINGLVTPLLPWDPPFWPPWPKKILIICRDSPYEIACEIWSLYLKKWLSYCTRYKRGHFLLLLYSSILSKLFKLQTKEVSSFVPSAITQPFLSFRLQILHGSSYGLSRQIMRFFLGHGRQKGGSHRRQGVTQPFFELQTPYFAWKFIWTVPTNY